MSQLMKLYDLQSRYERGVLEMSKRYLEQTEADYRSVYKKWEEGELFPGETIVRKKPWWRMFARSETIELPGKQLSRPAFLKWYAKRLEMQKLLYAAGGAREDEVWRLSYRRQLDFYLMLHQLNDHYGLFYRPVALYQQGEVELGSFVVGPTAIHLIAWLDGEESIYHVSPAKKWMEQPFKGETRQVLSPLIDLKRTEDILKHLLAGESDLPIERIIVASKGYFDHVPKDATSTYVNKIDFQAWIRRMNDLAPHTKAQQARICDRLLERMASATYAQAIERQEETFETAEE